MSDVIKAIEIEFENTESLIIPAEYFGWVNIDQIEVRIIRTAANAIQKRLIANQIEFELKKSAAKDVNQFEQFLFPPDEEGWSLFDRFTQSKDITHLRAIYRDRAIEDYMVCWEDEYKDEYSNRNQQVSYNDNGDMCVRIARSIEK